MQFDNISVGYWVVWTNLLTSELTTFAPHPGKTKRGGDVLVHKFGDIDDGVTTTDGERSIRVGRLARHLTVNTYNT